METDLQGVVEVRVVTREGLETAVIEALKALRETGTVTITGSNEEIPNVASVMEEVKANCHTPPETVETRVSLTLKLPNAPLQRNKKVISAPKQRSNSGSELNAVDFAPLYDLRHDAQEISTEEGKRMYRKVKAENLHVATPGELHISPKRPVIYYIKDAVLWFKREGKTRIVLKASGWAISQAVMAVEEIKRVVGGLHQIVTFGKRIVTDVFEPIESGLDIVTKERTIPSVEIVLATGQLDAKDPGYQTPLPSSLVKEMSVEDAEKLA